MPWKRIALLSAAGAALATAAPAFADSGRWTPAPGYGARHFPPGTVAVHPRAPAVIAHRHVTVAPRPVMAYRPPVRYAYAPAPAYRAAPHYAYGATGALAGAVAGALIGGSVTYGEQRIAGIAIGTVLGAVIGHELAGGY